MRLRYLFILTFCLVTLVPMVLFWAWPYSKALESELNDVQERHLVIAKNLAGAFERYYEDVINIYPIVNISLDSSNHDGSIKNLLKTYGFQSVMLVSKQGNIKACLLQTNKKCPIKISQNIIELANKTLVDKEVKISTVTEDKTVNSGPILLVVKKRGDDIVLGYLSTDYIVKMGKKVAFGKKGHAAVVDQEGNVLSHPLDFWIKNRKNISKVSAVQKMMEGKTGVETFFSPALKSDMIAGYTVVKNANWGVMVPQPLDELKNKAKKIDETAFFVMLLGLGLALLITISISFILIRPIERLSTVIKLIEKGDTDINFNLKVSKFFPSEIQELKNVFMKMMRKIEENKKSISQLAYIDVNTGLANRNYFYELSNQILDEMKNSNKQAALVFIDFDGFKSVNDTYGHRTGDELLELFAKRIKEHFCLKHENEECALFDKDQLPEVIPARLGGDEFVILFKNIKSTEEIQQKLELLFKDVFSQYDLYGGLAIKLTGSAGVALYPQDAKRYKDLLKAADMAMYEAKASGKNCIKFYKA